MGTEAALPPIPPPEHRLPRPLDVTGPTPPPEQRLVDRLAIRQRSEPTPTRATAMTVLGELGQIDLAVYRAIAGSRTPTLDRPMRRLSAAANWSRLGLVIGGAMAVAGGSAGRRAARAGLVAL